ncbi:MAG: endonuclease/exonuclease/phosphatase family protein [Polyangiaceae bacterium]|nr:endonuclease/exonuclease/phosphatase family protein [Polyangiaceae bacterium]
MRSLKLERILLAFALGLACRTPPEHDEPIGQEPIPEPPIPPAAVEPAPTIDGSFDDWSEIAAIAADAQDDAVGSFDVTRIQATARGSELFVRLDTSTILNLYSGPSEDGTLVLGVRVEDGRELRVDLRARHVELSGGSALPWSALHFVASPNHASNDFEMRLDLSALDVAEGQRIAVWLEGSDTVSQAEIVAGAPPPAAPELDVSSSDSAVRVASLNTHLEGLADPYRAPKIRRLLRAAEADVYSLQELGTMPDDAIADALNSAHVDGSDAPWNVYGVSYGQYVKSAVASRHPLVPIHTTLARFAGAIVLFDGGPVAVFSVHFKCCGYYGSPEDETRLWEADLLRRTIQSLREGNLGTAYDEYAAAPVVVMGDFNDVGSPQLQTLFTAYPLELSRGAPLHLAGRDSFTWRDDSGFPPAILDLTLYDGLAMSRAFVLDSALLDADALEELDLSTSDSEGSDHLLVVADFDRAD